MPSKNIRKQYVEDADYHVYSRGVNKQPVFIDEFDYLYFLEILKRYLSNEPKVSSSRVTYKHFAPEVTLIAFCLMPNHIHLLVHQKNKDSISRFMQSVMTSYSMYFNKRHKRVGPVFQSRYLARRIDSEGYLHHISRYIHLNPKFWDTYEYSSLPYYKGKKSAEWLHPESVIELFDGSSEKYLTFLNDYRDQKRILEAVKWEMAHEDE